MAAHTNPNRAEVAPEPSTREARHQDFAIRVAIALGLAAFFVAVGLIVYLASEVFVLAGAGVLIAVLLGAMADFVAKHTPLPRGWALTLILLVMAGALGLASWKMASNLDEQFRDLSKSLVESGHKIEDQLNKYDWGRKLVENTKNLQPPPGGNAEMFGRFTKFFSSTLGGLVDAVIILFIGVYGAADRRRTARA